MTRFFRSCLALPLAALALAGPLSGCPATGIVCNAGLSACGTGCADFTNDPFNCGACGSSCQQTQICVSSVCQCETGALTCGSKCVIPSTDPDNCGACGVACLGTQVCQQGQCVGSCSADAGQCGRSCTNTQADPFNCGACNHACAQGMGCRSGACGYDLVAACLTAGEVVGLRAGNDVLGPLSPLGTEPYALATMDGVLLSADQVDPVLYEGSLATLTQLPEAPGLGSGANQTLVDEPYVYVVNSLDNTLQVLQRHGVPLPQDGGTTADAGTADGGLGLVTIQEINLGANTSPEWAAKVGTDLWITLYGAYGAPVSTGQKVLRVDLTPLPGGPPRVTTTIDLGTLQLPVFDGGTSADAGPPIARPQAIVSHNGILYAVLNNLFASYSVAGPGALARIDPSTGIASLIPLGASCLDPVNVIADSANLYVLCFGSATYDQNFNVISNTGAGLALVSAPADAGEVVLSSWTASCPAPAGTADAGCLPVVPTSVAQVGNRIYVGDGEGGRIFAVDVLGNQLVERRGYGLTSGAPIAACPFVSKQAFTNVASLVAP
jgi:hypothetical protein